ncbi:cellulase family glycosylhydrolase [Marinoscillum furvescens]|uniref:Putative secreted protein (Por secretion system target) n=1 Tax=Marinoscillum furvescens DSM 4134 TaxID=1122208 RepID=A0A3D9L5B8_MARFU|nr:cellulase family glycosylhydrolase [Marinoscillum furvescens]RED99819.1 putative secreted protein (Por secretion system target) [Marinoscillum furvescens DSM 4134]
MTKSNSQHVIIRKPFGWIQMCFLCLLLMASISQATAQYVRAQGTQIVDETGAPIYFRGMNLGNWLLWEGYLMMGDFEYRTHTQFFNGVKDAFGGDLGQAMEFEHQWRLNYLNEQAIVDLKNLGFNSVRVPFHYNLFWDYGSYSTTNRGFQYLDRVVNWCRTHGLYVLLDMHAAPGYQNPGDHCDNNDSDASQPRSSVGFWDGDNVNIASQVWRHIANYYKNEPVIWGYDLINEPVPQPGREYELLPSLITMRNAIREVDNNHIIVAEGSWWGSDMQKLDWEDAQVQSQSGVNSRWDNNLVYQTHHYSDDVSLLNGRKALTDRLNVPLMLGEYGENTNAKLREMTDWCINNNVAYFPWSFKKMYHDRCLWTIHPNNAYNAVRDYIKYGGTPPANAYNDMISFCQNNIGNGASGFTFHQGFYDAVAYTGPSGGGSGGGAPIGQTIWLRGNNGQYVSSENGQSGMMCNRSSVGGWEQFEVVGLSDGKIALKGSNNRYVSNEGGTSAMMCDRPNVQGWESFTWESQGANTVALKGFNNQYVSSEDGQSPLMCNRSSIGGWEVFTWGTGSGSRTSASGVEESLSFSVFPNPASEQITITWPGEGNAVFRLLDVSGRAVMERELQVSQSTWALPDHLEAGVYFVMLKAGGVEHKHKLIIE